MTFKGKAAAKERSHQAGKLTRFAKRPFWARASAFSPPAGRFMPRPFGGEKESAPGTKAEAFRPKSDGGLDIGAIDLFPVQTKLRVGAADDPYEREADRVAERVMSMPEPGSNTVQRLEDMDEGGEEEEEEEEVWTKPLAGSMTPLQRSAGGLDAGRDLEGRLASRRGRGQPLSEDVRSHMEPRFGADFGGVRLHADGEAADMAGELKARAFTHGEDVYLGKGYGAGSREDQRLLAHELAHVVQQSGGASLPYKSTTKDFKLTGAGDPIVQRMTEGEVLNSTEVTSATTNDEKADAAFDKYIELLRRDGFKYTTKSKRGTNVLAGSTEGACASLAIGFVNLLKDAHIDDNAHYETIDLKFMTIPLDRMNFIDPTSVGNVRREKGGYGDVNRFFFSGGHYITNSPGLGKRYDPTTGLKDNAIDGAIAEEFKGKAGGGMWVSKRSKIEMLKDEDPGTGGVGYLWKKRSLLSRLFSIFSK